MGERTAPVSRSRTQLQPDLVVVRYSEIFLKGDNRPVFESALERNLRRALRGYPGLRVERHHARCVARAMTPEADLSVALARITRVFGVATASLAVSCPRDMDALTERGAALIGEAAGRGARTFCVRARRSDKRFPVTSPQINTVIGEVARIHSGLKVDLGNPDVTLTVEIGPHLCFVSTHVAPGPGGLPVGVSGNVLLLLSGGIDSPMAGYLSQKRGCRVIAIYFHSPPYTGEPAKQKVVELARELGALQGGIRLVVIPFTELQEEFRDRANPRLLVILYRRAMMRIAARVADLEGALALTTGENLGQVASQTLENIACIEAVADRPVLRPLITYDKAEIIALARRVGTYEISVRPFDDCCSLFVPRHPATRCRLADLEAAERKVALDDMIGKAVASRETIDIAD